MTEFDLFCSCPLGLENALHQELKEIFQTNTSEKIKTAHQFTIATGGIFWPGTLSMAMMINLYSRIASRVLIKLKEGFYQNENDIYNVAKSYPWENWINSKKTIRVHCHAKKTHLVSVNFITLRIKDAICDRLREKEGERPSVDTLNPDIQIFSFLTSSNVSLYLDTSGQSLFKRGWRLEKGLAPMKENLAAGILHLTNWHPGESFFDPMCGSGTMIIEAAQTILNIPPGINRTFAFEKFLPYSKIEWITIKKEANNKAEHTKNSAFAKDALALLRASDISEEMIQITKHNLERAGIPAINIKQIDAQSISPDPDRFPTGVLFINPPYGERINPSGDNAQDFSNYRYNNLNVKLGKKESLYLKNRQTNFFFFKKFGDLLKKNFSGWRVFVLTPDFNFPRMIRLKETRRTPLFNGPIECRLFRFNLVTGSMRKIKNTKIEA